jgi:DinB superfamily
MMIENRVERLLEKLERGCAKTSITLKALPLDAWQVRIHPEQGWRVRDLLAHFLSAEVHLLTLARAMAAGKPGAADGLDIDEFNKQEQARLANLSVEDLLGQLEAARRETITWVRTLSAGQMDKTGRHPVLGEINLEIMIESIYGHQLMHMRELSQALGTSPKTSS